MSTSARTGYPPSVFSFDMIQRCHKPLLSGRNTSGTISRRVAGLWSIWLVWFDERERQNRPAHQIDCQEFAFLRFAVRVCRCHLLSFLYLLLLLLILRHSMTCPFISQSGHAFSTT